MGDPARTRPARCVNSKGKDEQCWCRLASVMCARQSHNRDSFFAAIRQNRQDVVNFLLSPQNCEQERITDFRDWLHVRDTDGRCGLHVAVKCKKHSIIAILVSHITKELDYEILLDLADPAGMNAILEACQIGSLSSFQALHDAGAPWTTCNGEQKNGRDIALEAGHNSIVDFIDRGQNMGQEDAEREAAPEDETSDGDGEFEDEGASAGAAAGGGEGQQAAEPVEDNVALREGLDEEPEEDEPPEADEQELQDRCDIIHMHPAFETFEQSHTQMAARGSVLHKYKRNEVILGPQAAAKERAVLLFVLSGEVRIQTPNNDRHDVLLEEGDSYGERALLLGQESTDIVSANKDCYVMVLMKRVIEPILLNNPIYAETVGASLAAKLLQDAQHGNIETTSEMQEGEFHFAKELEKRIYSFYEIPIPEVIEEPVDRNRREVEDVPLLEDVLDGLPIKFKHTYELGSDMKVNARLRRSAAKIDEEDLFQYVEGCHELGTQPLNAVIFQIRRPEKLLDLRGLRVTSTEALALSSALTLMTRPLEGFDLSNNPIFDKGCINSESVRFCGIVNSIALNANIRTVILSRTRISAATAAQLGKVVSYHGTMAKLDLSSNDLRDDGIESLANGLMSAPNMRELNLSNTKCSFRGATALGAMLSSNQTLQIVNLSWNSFLCKGSTAVLEGMKAHPKLEEVHMEWNLLGHTGGVALGNVLGTTQSIQRIDVSHCSIPESATDSICAGLRKTSTLQNLRLQFNPLKLGVPRIKEAMLENKNWAEKLPSIRLDHCDFDTTQYHSSVVNATIPTGHYKFDLSKPIDRKELDSLIALATRENGENWRNETLNGERFNYPTNTAWVPPAKGILELDFVHMEKSEDDILSESNADILLSSLNAAVSPEVRIELIKQACMGFRITGDDAMRILYSLNRRAEKEEALIALFSRLCSRDAVMPKILLSHFKRREVEHVQHRLGTYYAFDSYRPEGKYRFALGKQLELDALLHLLTFQQKIPSSHVRCKLSQLKTPTRFEIVDNVKDFVSADHCPTSGILELEFSIPDTPEAHAQKKTAIASELERLTRSASQTFGEHTSLATLGFDMGADSEHGHDSDDDSDNRKQFDFAAAMQRTRVEYKLVTVLHPDKAGLVRCADMGMGDKPFNFQWDGGKTTIVCMLEDVKEEKSVQVLTPRGTNEYASVLITWDTDFKTIIDIGHKEAAEEVTKRESSAVHDARLLKFEQRKNSPAKQKTVPKKGGKGLRPVTPETFSGVSTLGWPSCGDSTMGWPSSKSLDFRLALRRSQGERMYKPWTGFVRSHPDDFKVEHVNLPGMGRYKDVGGVVSKKLKGTLGPSSCANFEFDMSMLISMHTVPRYLSFQITQGAEMNLYAHTTSLPHENDFTWKGELTETGERIIVIRPTDKNMARKCYVSVISGIEPGSFELLVEVAPYLASLKFVESLKLPRFASTKTKTLRSGLMPPKKVADVTSQPSKAGKMLSSLMNFTEERKSKSCFGAAVPDKAIITIRAQGAGDLKLSHSGSSSNLRSPSVHSSRSRSSISSIAPSPI